MPSDRRFAGTAVALGLLAFVHALATWPLAATLALFGVGAVTAFVGEWVVVARGWLVHHTGPRVGSVPLPVLFGWTVTVYVALRLALLATAGVPAAVLAGLLATAYDLLTDHYGVDAGYWSYTDDLPGPRLRGVPWWNFVGWFVVSTVTALAALPFL